MSSPRVRISSDDTERVDFLLDSISAKHCTRCGGRAYLINHGRSVYMEHRQGCPEIPEAQAEAEIPSTFKS